MTCFSIWLDLPAIASFSAMSYYLTLSQQDTNDCKMLPFFVTSIIIILMFLYSLAEQSILDLSRRFSGGKEPHSKVLFTVDELAEDEQDGTPLPPDYKSGIRINTDQVSCTISL